MVQVVQGDAPTPPTPYTYDGNETLTHAMNKRLPWTTWTSHGGTDCRLSVFLVQGGPGWSRDTAYPRLVTYRRHIVRHRRRRGLCRDRASRPSRRGARHRRPRRPAAREQRHHCRMSTRACATGAGAGAGVLQPAVGGPGVVLAGASTTPIGTEAAPPSAATVSPSAPAPGGGRHRGPRRGTASAARGRSPHTPWGVACPPAGLEGELGGGSSP